MTSPADSENLPQRQPLSPAEERLRAILRGEPTEADVLREREEAETSRELAWELARQLAGHIETPLQPLNPEEGSTDDSAETGVTLYSAERDMTIVVSLETAFVRLGGDYTNPKEDWLRHGVSPEHFMSDPEFMHTVRVDYHRGKHDPRGTYYDERYSAAEGSEEGNLIGQLILIKDAAVYPKRVASDQLALPSSAHEQASPVDSVDVTMAWCKEGEGDRSKPAVLRKLLEWAQGVEVLAPPENRMSRELGDRALEQTTEL